MSDALQTAMESILDGQLMSSINGAFACMEVAEEVIAASGCSHTDGSKGFAIMCPSPPMRGKAPEVFKHHCQELLTRVLAGDDTRPGTETEVLCVLMAAATKAPLNAAGLALADYLFRRVMPERNLGAPVAEVYEGQVQEDLNAARHQCADWERKS